MFASGPLTGTFPLPAGRVHSDTAIVDDRPSGMSLMRVTIEAEEPTVALNLERVRRIADRRRSVDRDNVRESVALVNVGKHIPVLSTAIGQVANRDTEETGLI